MRPVPSIAGQAPPGPARGGGGGGQRPSRKAPSGTCHTPLALMPHSGTPRRRVREGHTESDCSVTMVRAWCPAILARGAPRQRSVLLRVSFHLDIREAVRDASSPTNCNGAEQQKRAEVYMGQCRRFHPTSSGSEGARILTRSAAVVTPA